MSNKSSIHDFDLNTIIEYFTYTKRQGPGSPETTLKALSFIDNLSAESQIADLGCGKGGNTMVLAKHTEGQITAMDLFPAFIKGFNENVEKHQLGHRVRGIEGSMDKLPFKEESLDLIWSEGAIYNIGFEQGLKYWHQFLKKDAYVAVSEATWFTEERPAEIHDFWMDAYTGIDTLSNKVAQLQKAGYVPVAAFNLPDNCWTEYYFGPQVEPRKAFLKKHKGNKAAEGFIANQRHEEQLYNKYKSYYGYTFYIGKKI